MPRTIHLIGPLLLTFVLAVAASAEPTAQIVHFRAADGVRITADYFKPATTEPASAPMAILLHMYRSDRSAWSPLIAPLHDAGFAVLAIDMRGHGDSATTSSRERVIDRDTEIFREMQNDVRGAYDWLAERPEVDRSRFAIVGASVGCSIALQYAAKDRSVDAIVCLSPGLNYLGLDSAGDIAQITGRPVLMVATEDERDAPYTLKKRGQSVSVHIHKGDQAHGTRMFGVVPDLDQRIAGFLKESVGDPSTEVVYGSINSHIFHEADSGWVKKISPTNLRYYSSPKEADDRGLRAARSKRPGDFGRSREKP